MIIKLDELLPALKKLHSQYLLTRDHEYYPTQDVLEELLLATTVFFSVIGYTQEPEAGERELTQEDRKWIDGKWEAYKGGGDDRRSKI